jgi:hypothetical protein
MWHTCRCFAAAGSGLCQQVRAGLPYFVLVDKILNGVGLKQVFPVYQYIRYFILAAPALNGAFAHVKQQRYIFYCKQRRKRQVGVK